MTISRKAISIYLAALLTCVSIVSPAKTTKTNEAIAAWAAREAAQDPSGNVNLSISFSGPMAFVVDGDDVIVYAPRADQHMAVAHTSANDSHLREDTNYELAGLPNPSGETATVFPPAEFNIQGPYPEAESGRYFKIKLKRPDLMVGLRLVDVFLTGRNGEHARQTLPTGLRFIYKDVPRNIALKLTGTDGSTYTPSFSVDEQEGLGRFDLAFEMMSMVMNDSCHQDARSSFKKVVDLFPATNILSVRYDQEDPNCAMRASGAGSLMEATFHASAPWGSQGEGEAIHQNPAYGARLLLAGGSATDCQSVVVVVKNSAPTP